MSRQALLDYLHERAPVVAPSMLQCDFGDLRHEISALEAAGTQVLHLDVMDGHFVPNLTYGPVVIERLRALTKLPFDAHLMITEPQNSVDDYIAAGCGAITFHIEAVPDPRSLLTHLRERDCVAGLALNPDTPVSRVEPYLGMADLVLVMSVPPGAGGQKFDDRSLDKAADLRRHCPPRTLLSIDGGINLGTIGRAAAAGVNLFVAGSAVFRATDYRSALSQLRASAVAARG